MTVNDARTYWMSSRIPSDQYVLYCFAAPTVTGTPLVGDILARARRIEDLTVRVRDVSGDFPWWVAMDVDAGHVVEHAADTWDRCRAAVEDLVTVPLDARVTPWRVHLFGPLSGAPRCEDGPAVIAVVQIAHCLADGTRTARITRALFGPEVPVAAYIEPDEPDPPWRRRLHLLGRILATVRLGWVAARTSRVLAEDTRAGRVPAPTPGRPLTRLNRKPDERRIIRVITLPTTEVRAHGVSVTAGAMTAISLAIERYSGSAAGASAETTFANPGPPLSHNHFRNAGVDLHAGTADLAERATLIAADLGRRKERFAHPAFAAGDRATAVVPAHFIRKSVDDFDLDVVPDTMTGATVVSSVNRGAADLILGGGAVRFTAGFPGLSPSMGLTHGVHGIGDVVTVSVLTSPAVVPDIDRYEALLRGALADVCAALSRLPLVAWQ